MTKPPECLSSWAVYVLLATESRRSPPFPFAPGVWPSLLFLCVDMSASISARSSLIQRFKAVAGEKDSSCKQRILSSHRLTFSTHTEFSHRPPYALWRTDAFLQAGTH